MNLIMIGLKKALGFAFSKLLNAAVAYFPVMILEALFDLLDEAVRSVLENFREKYVDNPKPRYMRRVKMAEKYWAGFQGYLKAD